MPSHVPAAEIPGCDVPRRPALKTNEPPPAGPVGAHRNRDDGWRSAADLEDLSAADRAGALERGLAVLHRDLLRVLDLDLLLVLDAVGLCHLSTPPHADRVTRARLSCPRIAWVLALSLGTRETGASAPSGLDLLAIDLREDHEALEPPSPPRRPPPGPCLLRRRTRRSDGLRTRRIRRR